MLRWFSGLLCVACAGVLASAQPAQPGFDVLIRNGRVMDGTGNPWLRADIGIRGDRIAAIGRLADGTARRIIDAADRLVTPGFIDVHSHAAEGLARPQLRQGRPLLAQGITTIVANPDGGGPVDLAAQRTRLESGGLGPNVALLIGHGSVRREVLGNANRAPTGEELERMRTLVRRGMSEGAFGLSSGLFYTPGSFAKIEEVIALARVAGERGGVYTSHIRDEANYNIGLVASVQEVVRVAEEANVVGIVTHMKALGPDNWGLSVAATSRIDGARARGVQVFADQYPYEASSTNLRAALLPGGIDPTEASVRENLKRRGGPDSIQIAVFKPDPSLEGQTLAQIAASRKASPEETAMELISRGSASIVSFNMSEADIRHIMTRPYTMASSDGGLILPSEGKPHPRDYGAFARRLAVYVRERNVVALEFAIRSMTTLPASVFSIKDRGMLREGAFADLAIFDPAKIRDVATYADPHHVAEGMSYVLVNGVVVVDDAKFTEALPGRVLRKP
jgi:N-acyl-D-aspartate/D-glutamate deacylase